MSTAAEAEHDEWRRQLDDAARWRARLHRPAALLPELIVDVVLAAIASGGYISTSSLRSGRHDRQRILRGRSVKCDAWWNQVRLSPESVDVVVGSGQATLQRRFADPIDLARRFSVVGFVTAEQAGSGHGDGITWLELDGGGTRRFLGAELPSLLMIGYCAGWRYPEATSSETRRR